jgi:hypothetical protein
MQEEEIDRVIIKTDSNYCQVIIPAKRDWAVIYFSSAILAFALVVIIALSLSLLLSHSNKSTSDLIFFCAPFVFIILGTPVFVWNTIGKEIITIDKGIMTIDRAGMFFEAKSYNLVFIKNLRDESYDENKWTTVGKLNVVVSLGGTFLFDYRGEQIKFGDSVDKDDADLVLKRLEELKLFTPSNFIDQHS